MNVLKGIAFVAVISYEEVRLKIKHILEINSFRKKVEDEQAKRHREFQAYMQKYLECVEKAKAEESNK